jgi:glutamine synthetase
MTVANQFSSGVSDSSVRKSTTSGSYLISSYFGQHVFADQNLIPYLSQDTIELLGKIAQSGESLTLKDAEIVADGMKRWALDNGCTHYTHWFQPLRGTTAEKHDAFFEPTGQTSGVESFSGKSLVQQEPDASSFPSGGIRNTFEARGYSAWDPSSPAFIIEKAGGKTLCIPTVFVSYTGYALDYKTPMLRSTQQIQQVATEVCQLFDTAVTSTKVSLGVEQEYFLVDLELYQKRPDLVLSGRTLLGHSPAKGQQLEDHYFGSIPERVFAYMIELEEEALKLGIPLKTRHNEVAPGQYECAPMFESINLAIDHNSLLMDLMDFVAERHGFKVLFHEKPFKGVNGSGKHNNWSVITNTGVNLFSPGHSPWDNLQFLTFFINTIKAVHEYGTLLRASIGSASNDHRLGANEAPPAIMSVFIGSLLSRVLDDFESGNTDNANSEDAIKGEKHLNIPHIPPILIDNTDRNRTSPFAFTGNKFELRAVGSADNCSSSMTVLNTIVANQLRIFLSDIQQLMNKQMSKENAITTTLKRYIKEARNIIFEGNGYSEDWVIEAEKRQLSNIKTTPHALGVYLDQKVVELFKNNHIFTEKELEARTEIRFEHYTLKVQIEGRVLADIVKTMVIPAAIEYQNKVLNNLYLQKKLKISEDYSNNVIMELAKKLDYHIDKVQSLTNAMVNERKSANRIDDAHQKAIAYCEKVLPYFDEIRYHSDKLEQLVDDAIWPMPKYRDLLFTK